MPRETGGGESHEQRGEAGRLDDWQRIEAEKPDRDRARKEWDAHNDPSDEFERAARPLGDDYGRDRPRHRELTPEQRAELEAFTGRSADELLALREKDPRAEHNRDASGRILDAHGNPRTPADARDQPGRTGSEEGGSSGDHPLEHRDGADDPQQHERDEQGERGGTWVRVGLDEHGNSDWSTARYETGRPYVPSDFAAPTDSDDSGSDRAAHEDGPTAPRDTGSERRGLDAQLSDHPDARTDREALNRFAGPEGLTTEQRLADDQHIAARAKDRPWLQIAANQDPEVRHVYCERDRADGHDPARHDGWRDAADQEQRASAAKDPAHATDSRAYHNAVDWFERSPPDDVGGKSKQHTPGEHTTWIADPTAWAVATVRAMEHPDVQQALDADNPPRNVKVPLEDILGPRGHRECDGFTLVTDGFDSPKAAKDNRDQWVLEVRKVMREQGVDRSEAEAAVEQRVDNGQLDLAKPEARRIETFENGTCQISFKSAKDGSGTAISTICYNPPTDETKGTR